MDKQIRGTTLVELVLAVAILAVVFTAVVPLFTYARNTTTVTTGNTEAIQNGRVLMNHLNRQLSTAVYIADISAANTILGYIEFVDEDLNTLRYEVSDGYVYYGPSGDLSLLAGPVSQFQFSGYGLEDLDTTTTDANDIRLVRIEAILDNPSEGPDKAFETTVFLSIYREFVGWWKLDEAAGTTALDSSGYRRHGTLQNMSGTEWTNGFWDGALEFDGSNDYVSLPIGTLISNLTDCTIATWVYWDGSSDWQRVWDFGSSESINMFLTMSNGTTHTPRFAMTVSGYWDEDQTTASSLLSSGWHHIAVTIEESTSVIHRLYIDGELSASNTSARYTPSDLGETDNNWLARSQYSADPYYDGRLDDVRIYRTALDADAIAALSAVPTFVDFTEAKVATEDTSITITTPSTDEDDLLVAAVATDGDTSSTLSAPSGEGWTQVSVQAYDSEVTLGVWWKLADASESASHTFTWSGSEQAYGWIMHFTGNSTSDPINDWWGTGGTSATPTSPSVTTTNQHCLIVRLGGFDGSDITENDTGIWGYDDITMDASNSGGSGDVTTDLVAQWTLDDGSGTTATDSVGSYDGSLTNMDGSSDWVTGHISGALDFDGTNDYVSLPIGSLIRNLRDSSVAVWVNWQGSDDWERIWDFGSSETVNMFLTVSEDENGSHAPRFAITVSGSGSSNEDQTTSPSTLSSGWHHLVVTINESSGGGGGGRGGWGGGSGTTVTHELYVDGSLVATNSSGRYCPEDLGTTSNNYLGRSQYTWDPYFDGQLDDLRIYDDDLTSSEVSQLYNWTDNDGEVSGGAAYQTQTQSGSSGTENFSLTASQESRTLTIAIAPQ